MIDWAGMLDVAMSGLTLILGISAALAIAIPAAWVAGAMRGNDD